MRTPKDVFGDKAPKTIGDRLAVTSAAITEGLRLQAKMRARGASKRHIIILREDDTLTA